MFNRGLDSCMELARIPWCRNLTNVALPPSSGTNGFRAESGQPGLRGNNPLRPPSTSARGKPLASAMGSLTCPASPGRTACAPRAIAFSLYRGLSPATRFPTMSVVPCRTYSAPRPFWGELGQRPGHRRDRQRSARGRPPRGATKPGDAGRAFWNRDLCRH